MAVYSRVDYWDLRYQDDGETAREWYQGYKSLRHLLNPIHFSAQGTAPSTKATFHHHHIAATTQHSQLQQQQQQQHQLQQQFHQLYQPYDSVSSKPPPPSTAGMSVFPARDAARVLILGCGNSRFGEDMRYDGWTGRMVNIDFSSVVIEQMKKRYDGSSYEKTLMEKKARMSEMEFICHDVTTGLPFPDESFDLIVCKGSFDAILTSAGSVSSILRLVQDCARCLARGHGIFFLVTPGNQDSRIVFLEHENRIDHYWHAVGVYDAPRPVMANTAPQKSDYVYICRRRAAPSSESQSTVEMENEQQKQAASMVTASSLGSSVSK